MLYLVIDKAGGLESYAYILPTPLLCFYSKLHDTFLEANLFKDPKTNY